MCEVMFHTYVHPMTEAAKADSVRAMGTTPLKNGMGPPLDSMQKEQRSKL